MQNSVEERLPASVAVAGYRGYIGDRIWAAGKKAGLQMYGYDPAEPSAEVGDSTICSSAEQFYQAPARIFHLALHPEARDDGWTRLMRRSQREQLAILMEKPMATPEDPQMCDRVIQQVEQSQAVVLYNFPELFDPITWEIIRFLKQHQTVQIRRIHVVRSKDRESDTPRNRKRMVTIQYQESVHCLAFACFLIAAVEDFYSAALLHGVRIWGESRPYNPPNPEDYAHVVDGYCQYVMDCGPVAVMGVTDFSHRAPCMKYRRIEGSADGQSFCIEADYAEGCKSLRINGVDRTAGLAGCSYRAVLASYAGWLADYSRDSLLSEVFPHPSFARMVYQLSSMLWLSCYERCSVSASDLRQVLAFNAGYAAAEPTFELYQ